MDSPPEMNHQNNQEERSALWSFDDATDEDDDYQDATTLNRSMLITTDTTTPAPSKVSSLQQLSKDTLRDLESPQHKFRGMSLTPSASIVKSTMSKIERHEDPKRDDHIQSSSTLPGDENSYCLTSIALTSNEDARTQTDMTTNSASEDMVETVIELMKKREGALTFGTVEEVYSFRAIRCLFRVSSIQDEGTMGLYRLCRFEVAVASEDISKAIIIDSNKRELLFCCPKLLIDEEECYQFCFKNKSGEVIQASLPFKIMVDEFGSRSVLEEGHKDRLGCISHEDDAILQGSNNANPDEDDEGDFVVVRSKKILLEEKIRELSAYIEVVEHDRLCKRNLIENLKSELNYLKDKVETLEIEHRGCDKQAKALVEDLAQSRRESSNDIACLRKKIDALTQQLEESKTSFKTSQRECNAEKAAREAYVNSLKLTVTDLERQLKSKNKFIAESTKLIETEKIVSENRAIEIGRQLECIKELNDKLENSYKNQKNYLSLADQLLGLQARNADLLKEKTQLDEVLSQKCKAFAEQEEQSANCIRQLKARLSQAAEEYEQLFRKNYKLEKKYNRLQTKVTSMSFGTDGSNDTLNKTGQSRSILAEVTEEISRINSRNNTVSLPIDPNNLISRIQFQQQNLQSEPASISQPYSIESPALHQPFVKAFLDPLMKCKHCTGLDQSSGDATCSECKLRSMNIMKMLSVDDSGFREPKQETTNARSVQTAIKKIFTKNGQSKSDDKIELVKIKESETRPVAANTSNESNITIPCSYCDESIVCTTTNLNPILSHFDQQHKSRVCPICGLPFDVKHPEAEDFYHKHVTLHLDSNSWPGSSDKTKKTPIASTSSETTSDAATTSGRSNMPGVSGIANGMGRRSHHARNPLEEFFNKFIKQD